MGDWTYGQHDNFEFLSTTLRTGIWKISFGSLENAVTVGMSPVRDIPSGSYLTRATLISIARKCLVLAGRVNEDGEFLPGANLLKGPDGDS